MPRVLAILHAPRPARQCGDRSVNDRPPRDEHPAEARQVYPHQAGVPVEVGIAVAAIAIAAVAIAIAKAAVTIAVATVAVPEVAVIRAEEVRAVSAYARPPESTGASVQGQIAIDRVVDRADVIAPVDRDSDRLLLSVERLAQAPLRPKERPVFARATRFAAPRFMPTLPARWDATL